MKNLKTLTGFRAEELPEVLDKPLPAGAYKEIKGSGADLTDIDAAWQRRAFNSIFGLYGLGWGLEFSPEEVDVRNEPNKNGKMQSLARVIGRFWFLLIDKDGNESKISYPVTGGNGSFTNEGYALKGAITNAIGFGASMIGWQESVYMGIRTHRDTNASVARKKAPVEEVKPEVKPEPKPKPAITKKPEVYYYGCETCKEVFTSKYSEQATHKCGNKCIKLENIEAAEKQKEEFQKQVQLEELEKNSGPSLAENSGFENIKYPVCVQCGWGEPVNKLPPACPECGVVAEESFTMGNNHEHFKTIKNGVEDKIKAAKNKTSSNDVKAALDALKNCCNNDRRSILSNLSSSTGRTIKSYSEASPEEMLACVDYIKSKSQGNDKPDVTVAVKRSKTEIVREIYGVANTLKLGTPKRVLAKIGELAGKENLSSAAHLNEEELEKVLIQLKQEVS